MRKFIPITVTALSVVLLGLVAFAVENTAKPAQDPAVAPSSPMAAAATKPSDPVNNKCPIMGGAINKDKLTPELTTQFKGQTVAFCCSACPAQWNKLTDAQKQAKLDAVRTPTTQTAKSTGCGCCGGM